ncbi:hypothetical protein [Catenuloplanes japonicus]|uniref:hypothetical protein n=1 Tax=Catenuloplanes japonicus TaxID=33876 RepID=UPI000526B768|nr:hypothetical protein [Catenuloplanes japonicus]
MSRTDKTRPWWVQMADAPMTACRPHHDHRFGPCTLPADITRDTAWLGDRRSACYWTGTWSYWYRRVESHGSAEWAFICRTERRRSRHDARRALRRYRAED